MNLPAYTSASQIVLILAFALIGAGLKFIDDAFDEDRFNKKMAILLAPFIVILWIYLSLSDTVSATILFSILFAVLVSGKIDNMVFKISAITLILLLLLTQLITLLWIPLFILILMGVADEKGNDYIDNRKVHKLTVFFFTYRFSMKIGVLSLCICSLLPWLYLFAFLAFDGAYESVKMVGKILAEHQEKKKSKKYGIPFSPTVSE
jgi:hypothetical protein